MAQISYDQLVRWVGNAPGFGAWGDILCLSVPHDQGCLSLGRTAASFGRICCRQNPSSNCGAGYSGVELACKLADRLGERGRFRLIELTDQILRTSQSLTSQQLVKPWKRGVFGLI